MAKKRKPKPTLSQRLDRCADGLKQLRALDNKRRADAGPQRPHDHDRSATWQNRRLPTFNP